MAFHLPSISYSFTSHSKSIDKLIPHLSSPPPSPPPRPLLPPLPLLQPLIFPHLQCANHLITLPPPPHTRFNATSLRDTEVKGSLGAQDNDQHQKDDFYLNLGIAVRTLREDLPQIFTKELNYDIYREDITFVDPINTFCGIDNYKLIFRAFRFHGRILFREIDLEVLRIWQISENMILVRWNLRGTPRVPWEAKGDFQGTSRYKLDRRGKIYEHKVDNFALNFPHPKKPMGVLDLVVAPRVTPTPTFFWAPEEEFSSSWVELYRSVRENLDHHQQAELLARDGLAICSL
ncbi:hypothetical protein Dimus_011063 [Dionaea muscipula]